MRRPLAGAVGVHDVDLPARALRAQPLRVEELAAVGRPVGQVRAAPRQARHALLALAARRHRPHLAAALEGDRAVRARERGLRGQRRHAEPAQRGGRRGERPCAPASCAGGSSRTAHVRSLLGPEKRQSSGRRVGRSRAPNSSRTPKSRSGGLQWSATCPLSGSMGSPRRAQPSRPPTIEYASKPARRNALAASPERAPRRQ